MSVELEPAELGFKRPFTHEVSQVLRLRNNNSDPVAFKVKTTAPKQYCVRPNSGRIESGKDVEVQVLLQAMKEDPPPDAKCRDKFLVQSVAIAAGNDPNVSQIWSNIEQNAKSSIQEKKIRVNFLPADSTTTSSTTGTGSSSLSPGAVAAGAGGAATAAAATAATTNGVVSHDDEPPAYSSPSPSDRALPNQSSTADLSTFSAADTTAATDTSTLAAAKAAIPTSQEELQQQLDAAKAQISRLQEQVQEGIRQRKPQEAVEKAVASVQQSMQNAPAPGGVPVQIVAGLCLICFLIAWLFF